MDWNTQRRQKKGDSRGGSWPDPWNLATVADLAEKPVASRETVPVTAASQLQQCSQPQGVTAAAAGPVTLSIQLQGDPQLQRLPCLQQQSPPTWPLWSWQRCLPPWIPPVAEPGDPRHGGGMYPPSAPGGDASNIGSSKAPKHGNDEGTGDTTNRGMENWKVLSHR